MDKFDLNSIRAMDTKSIMATAKVVRGEISDLIIDKNLNKLKDLRSVGKKKKQLAKMLTVLGQKKMLEQMEKKGESSKS